MTMSVRMPHHHHATRPEAPDGRRPAPPQIEDRPRPPRPDAPEGRRPAPPTGSQALTTAVDLLKLDGQIGGMNSPEHDALVSELKQLTANMPADQKLKLEQEAEAQVPSQGGPLASLMGLDGSQDLKNTLF
jgi:hypothetical protein